jgi:hypothetical protein
MNLEENMTSEINQDAMVDQKPIFGFIARFAVTHTAVYFFVGLIFSMLINYEQLFASSSYSFMRPIDHPLVYLGPILQIFRGALIAAAFLPFRSIIVENKRGWVYLFAALWILTNVAADAADPGKIEGVIYADFPLSVHLATYPEFTFHTLALAWLFHTWERNPKDKRLSVPILIVLVLAVLAAVLGLLFGGAA